MAKIEYNEAIEKMKINKFIKSKKELYLNINKQMIQSPTKPIRSGKRNKTVAPGSIGG